MRDGFRPPVERLGVRRQDACVPRKNQLSNLPPLILTGLIMKRKPSFRCLFGCLFILSISLCGCVGSPYGPCAPYSSYSPGQYGTCVNECDPCSPMSYAYGAPYCGLPGAPIRTIGCGAAQIAATPVSWLAQILRGTAYPCNGCGDELYWGDYGYVPGDWCNPCTYDGQWAGGDGGSCGGTVCQQGLSYSHPAVGTYMNQMYAPVFQDKIASTHARTPLSYGLRGPYSGACYDSCYDSCYDPCCDTSCSDVGYSDCSTGCDTGYVGRNGSRVSPGYAPPRQQTYHSRTTRPSEMYDDSMVTTVSARTAKPSSSVANKVYPPVRR